MELPGCIELWNHGPMGVGHDVAPRDVEQQSGISQECCAGRASPLQWMCRGGELRVWNVRSYDMRVGEVGRRHRWWIGSPSTRHSGPRFALCSPPLVLEWPSPHLLSCTTPAACSWKPICPQATCTCARPQGSPMHAFALGQRVPAGGAQLRDARSHAARALCGGPLCPCRPYPRQPGGRGRRTRHRCGGSQRHAVETLVGHPQPRRPARTQHLTGRGDQDQHEPPVPTRLGRTDRTDRVHIMQRPACQCAALLDGLPALRRVARHTQGIPPAMHEEIRVDNTLGPLGRRHMGTPRTVAANTPGVAITRALSPRWDREAAPAPGDD